MAVIHESGRHSLIERQALSWLCLPASMRPSKRFSTNRRARVAELPSGIVTFLFTDVEGRQTTRGSPLNRADHLGFSHLQQLGETDQEMS